MDGKRRYFKTEEDAMEFRAWHRELWDYTIRCNSRGFYLSAKKLY
jgi:hypothetical protein